jgi:hypothetical protein
MAARTMPMYTAASPGNSLPKFSAPAEGGAIARLAPLLQSMTGVADKDAPLSPLVAPELGVAGAVPTYATAPTRRPRRAKGKFRFHCSSFPAEPPPRF